MEKKNQKKSKKKAKKTNIIHEGNDLKKLDI